MPTATRWPPSAPPASWSIASSGSGSLRPRSPLRPPRTSSASPTGPAAVKPSADLCGAGRIRPTRRSLLEQVGLDRRGGGVGGHAEGPDLVGAEGGHDPPAEQRQVDRDALGRPAGGLIGPQYQAAARATAAARQSPACGTSR